MDAGNSSPPIPSVTCSVTLASDSLRPHGLQQARFLHPWNSPGKNTEMGFHSLLQGIFSNQGIEPGPPALQADILSSEPPGKPNQEGGTLWIYNNSKLPIFQGKVIRLPKAVYKVY